MEKKIARFLDTYYYSSISADTFFGRETQLSGQTAGIDLSCGDMLIDEKSKNTSAPDTIADYYSSVELYQTCRDGRWQKGWMIDKDVKTTHYDFLYRFEDANGDIEKVILVRWSRVDMLRFIDQRCGLKTVAYAASLKQHDVKGIDDVRYGGIKLTMSKEHAAVLNVTLSQISDLPNTKIIVVTKGGYREADKQRFKRWVLEQTNLKKKEISR